MNGSTPLVKTRGKLGPKCRFYNCSELLISFCFQFNSLLNEKVTRTIKQKYSCKTHTYAADLLRSGVNFTLSEFKSQFSCFHGDLSGAQASCLLPRCEFHPELLVTHNTVLHIYRQKNPKSHLLLAHQVPTKKKKSLSGYTHHFAYHL